ncbi:MAG: hypothetical protein ACYDAR_13305 [Thermomicrobiales bacterium]
MDQNVPPPMTFQLQTQMPMDAPDVPYSIRLVGEPASLDAVRGRVQTEGNRIVVFAREHFLISDQLNDSVMDWDYKGIADRLIERINTLGKLALDNYRSIGFDAIIWQKPDGRRWSTFQSQSFAYPGAVVARAGERIEGELTFEERCIALLPTYPEVDKALRLYGREDHDWVTLYRLFEVIQHHAGGSLDTKGWVSKAEISRFKGTCQHPDVIGNQSRHGYLPTQPLPNPMNLIEARDFIRQLLDGWFRHLSAQL